MKIINVGIKGVSIERIENEPKYFRKILAFFVFFDKM
jgi:hypothetical protein